MRNIFIHTYDSITTVENLLYAWKDFESGKKKKKDVQEFGYNLFENIHALYSDLKNKTYTHGVYTHFTITDPKQRDIHKASVRDRVVHHLLYNALYPYFDKKFIHDSYSCRFGKGTHRAIQRYRVFQNRASQNFTRQCWVLKCDIRKFFANIDHHILKDIIRKHISDEDVRCLIFHIVDSFHTAGRYGIGLPLGNLTSQLLINIYMNEFDQHIKHALKVRYYIRYADDFVIFSADQTYLKELLIQMDSFLQNRLSLQLHPDKVFIKTVYSGVDFLGWVHFRNHLVLRTVTKKRIFRRINETDKKEVIDSYLGLLSHGDGYKLKQAIKV